MSAQQRLNEHLAKWDATIRDLRTVALEAAEVEVLHRHRQAVVRATARRNEKAPEWLADALADEDPEAHELALRLARASAELDHLKARMRWAQSTAEGIRSEVFAEAAEAKLYERSTS